MEGWVGIRAPKRVRGCENGLGCTALDPKGQVLAGQETVLIEVLGQEVGGVLVLLHGRHHLRHVREL